jgi:hypothetical protein
VPPIGSARRTSSSRWTGPFPWCGHELNDRLSRRHVGFCTACSKLWHTVSGPAQPCRGTRANGARERGVDRSTGCVLGSLFLVSGVHNAATIPQVGDNSYLLPPGSQREVGPYYWLSSAAKGTTRCVKWRSWCAKWLSWCAHYVSVNSIEVAYVKGLTKNSWLLSVLRNFLDFRSHLPTAQGVARRRQVLNFVHNSTKGRETGTGRRDAETRGRGDAETRRRGDAETRELGGAGISRKRRREKLIGPSLAARDRVGSSAFC